MTVLQAPRQVLARLKQGLDPPCSSVLLAGSWQALNVDWLGVVSDRSVDAPVPHCLLRLIEDIDVHEPVDSLGKFNRGNDNGAKLAVTQQGIVRQRHLALPELLQPRLVTL